MLIQSLRQATVFLENESQLRLLRAHANEYNLNFIALSAEADYACEKNGLSYTTIEELYSEKELYEYGTGNQWRIESFCELFDRNAKEFLPLDDGNSLFSSRSHRYHIKIMFDALFFRSYTLWHALQKLKTEQIFYFRSPPAPVDDGLFFLNESLSSRILPYLAENQKIALAAIDTDGQPISPPLHALHHSDILLDPARPIMILASLWMNQEVLTAFTERGGQIVRAVDLAAHLKTTEGKDDSLNAGLRAFRMFLRKDRALHDLLLFNDIDLFPVIQDRLDFFINKVVYDHLQIARLFTNFMKTLESCVLMGNSPVSTLDAACFASARAAGVPSVVYQHGIFRNNVHYKTTDTALSDYCFCFGEGEVDFADKYLMEYDCGERTSALPVAVGSSSYDQLHQKQGQLDFHAPVRKDGPLRVCFALGSIVGDTRYFNGTNIPDIGYWRLERDVVSLCCSFKHVELYVKLFPVGADAAHNPIGEWIRDQNFPNCKIVNNIPFVTLLDQVDLVITDVPSSVLIESTATSKPVIVLIDQDYFLDKFQDSFRVLLERRATVATTKKQFFHAIAQILTDPGSINCNPVNNEFLKSYGTHLNDGKSANRAAKLLLQIAQGERLAANQPTVCRHEEWLSQIQNLTYSDYWNDEALEQNKDVFWVLDGNFEKMEHYLAEIGMIRLLEESARVARNRFGLEIHGTGCDIGAGNLWAEPHLFRLGTPNEIFCVEYSRHRLLKIGPAVLKHYGVPLDKIVLAIGDFHRLELPDSTLDFIFLAQAFHHSDYPVRLLDEMGRVLKPGGLIIMIGEHFAPDENSEEWLPPEPVLGDHIYTLKQYDQMFTAAGFQGINIRIQDTEFQGFVLRKNIDGVCQELCNTNTEITKPERETARTTKQCTHKDSKETDDMSTTRQDSILDQEQVNVISIDTYLGHFKLLCPNALCVWRAETLLTKEPETIEWISTFERQSILWDIGANVGLYSLIAARMGINVLAFEPSAFNYYVLNRNIELNKADNSILSYCLAFNDHTVIDHFYMANTETGGAMHGFAEALNHEGKPFTPAFRQGMLGFSIDEFIYRFSPPFPNHIKIDVDGIENKIIRGAVKTLADFRLKSVLIELEIDREETTNEVIEIIERSGLRLIARKHAPMFDNSPYASCYNYIFVRA